MKTLDDVVERAKELDSNMLEGDTDTDDLIRFVRDVAQMKPKPPEKLEQEVCRAYAHIMEYEGAVQVEPIDEAMKSRLERIKELEAHHQEHHQALTMGVCDCDVPVKLADGTCNTCGESVLEPGA